MRLLTGKTLLHAHTHTYTGAHTHTRTHTKPHVTQTGGKPF